MTNTTSTQSTELIRGIAACVKARVPVLLVGAPGQGKSAKLAALARSWGYHFETVTAANREATDFQGLPFEKSLHMDDFTAQVQGSLSIDWAARLNHEARKRPETGSILFLDEFNLQEDVMKAVLRVLEERYVGPDPLESNVAIIAAMNPTDLSTGGFDLPGPAANRMIHLNWEFDAQEWGQGMLHGFADLTYPPLEQMLCAGQAQDRARVAASVVQFTRSNPHTLNDCPTDPQAASGPWPSARMWHKAAQAIAQVRPDDHGTIRLLARGAVGDVGSDFVRWLEVQDLYDVPAVLEGKVTVDWKDRRLDRLYALGLAMAALVANSQDADTYARACRVAAGGAQARPDLAFHCFRLLVQHPPLGASIPADVVEVFAGHMQRVGLVVTA